jgi:hypothetical protein
VAFQIGGLLAREASWRCEDDARWPRWSAALVGKPVVIRAAVATLDRVGKKLRAWGTAWALHQREEQLEFGTGMQRVAALRAKEVQVGEDGERSSPNSIASAARTKGGLVTRFE